MIEWEENEEIQIFREYLRIPSVHPNIDYEPCVEFIRRQADSLGLPLKIVYPALKTKPLCIITYLGTSPDLPAIMLNSHMDVVPVSRDNWTHDPFAADIDENGKIFARGTQDTKELGTQYLGALRYFIRNKIQFKRTIHVVFTPEEEVSGVDGMREFVHTDEFKNLNVGFLLDEGAPMPTKDEFMIFYAERSTWRVEFTITGSPGHGSIMLHNNAAVKLQKLLTKFIEYRDSQINRIDNPLDIKTAGTVTSVNITMINGGLLSNVIPSEYIMTVDIRVALDIDHEEFIKMFEGWCNEAGDGISYKFEVRENKTPATPIDDSNPYWMAFKKTFDELDIKLVPIICPAATDARFIRSVGIPAIGFSPINNTPILAHAHDEYIEADMYLKGIDIFKKVISNLANLD
ncbi:aminoacylase-1-like [Chironomus tepperi]|uniref:aminoacylase-1-like n=1 Tax=Chironomus tepperi TaxID=113505 RepID=UPI00391F6D47